MKELEDIVKAFDKADAAGKRTALATVVHVEGSSYRRPGARMLVTEDGELTGAISGGCLEGDALRKACLAINQQKPKLVTYDTTDDENITLGVQLGCNGIVHILIEPILSQNPHHPIQLFKTIIQNRQNHVLVTLFYLHQKLSNHPGTCMLVNKDGIKNSLPADEALNHTVMHEAMQVLYNEATTIKPLPQPANLTGLIEFVEPAVSLIIAGAGNDTIPLTQMAALLGWQITVVDGRPNYATKQRFPQAHKILVAKSHEVLQQITIDSRTFFLLMTHNYNYDVALLQQLLQQPITYAGVLGPKKKLHKMLDELAGNGQPVSDEKLSAIYGPVGLDIGAETSEEIALSILAEIQSVIKERQGGFLRNRKEAIHAKEVAKD